jgi:Zn-finger nucleic acid-binding protein
MIDHDLYADFESSRVYPDNVPKPINPGEPDFRMVGTGPACGKSGVQVPLDCPVCHTSVMVGSSTCGKVECPTCWGTWARRGAARIGSRVWGFRQASKTHHKPRHATFDLDTADWKEAKKKAEFLGFTGGVIVIHPWRIKEEYRAMMEITAERTGKSRYDVVRDSALGMDAMTYSPHAHVLCYGKGVLVEKDSDQYLYRMIRRLNTLDALQGAVYYLLSHTFIPETPGQRTYRYFGSCLPQRLKPDWAGKIMDAIRCPDCGAFMVFPGSMICKEMSVYIATGWRIIIPKKRGGKPSVVERPGDLDLCTQGHPSFYYAGNFSTRSFV